MKRKEDTKAAIYLKIWELADHYGVPTDLMVDVANTFSEQAVERGLSDEEMMAVAEAPIRKIFKLAGRVANGSMSVDAFLAKLSEIEKRAEKAREGT